MEGDGSVVGWGERAALSQEKDHELQNKIGHRRVQRPLKALNVVTPKIYSCTFKSLFNAHPFPLPFPVKLKV